MQPISLVRRFSPGLPALDLVVAHKTRPGQERRVSHPEYLEVLDRLVRAHCGARCP